MQRCGVLAMTSLVLILGSTGCRSSCGERSGLFSRSRSQDPCTVPVIDRESGRGCGTGIFSVGRKKTHGIDGLPPDAVLVPGNAPTFSGVPIGPSYPSGVPIPVSPNGTMPNELPPPTISPPGVPESPFAQPIPAAQTGSTLPLPAQAGKPMAVPSASKR